MFSHPSNHKASNSLFVVSKGLPISVVLLLIFKRLRVFRSKIYCKDSSVNLASQIVNFTTTRSKTVRDL